MIDDFSLDRSGWARFSDDRRMRYRLARSLTDRPLEVDDGRVRGDRVVTFVMLNPSTADAFVLDPTIRRCVGFAQDWGADVLQVVNLFAFRSTDPQALYAAPNYYLLGDNLANNEEIVKACSGAMRVVAAWGVHGAHRERGKEIRQRLERNGIELVHLGRTKDGHPKHPLYLAASTAPELWR